VDKFFPMCYDVNDVGEFDDFIEEYKFGKAIAILQQALKVKRGEEVPRKENPSIMRLKIAVALDIADRKLKSFD